MKVYIGPYPNTWIRSQVYDRYMTKKYGCIWPTNHKPTKFENFLEWTEEVLQAFYNVTINKLIQNRERKIDVRIDDYDTWSADHTLALIILPLLKKLNKYGTPATDREDAPADAIYDDPVDDEYSRPFSDARWKYILGEMIYAFEMILNEDWDLEIYEKRGGWSKESLAERDEIQKRVSNGLRLFGKYYQSLWD